MALRDDAREIIRELAVGPERTFVFVHYYRGDISSECLPPAPKEQRPHAFLNAEEPFRRDALIELVAGRRGCQTSDLNRTPKARSAATE